ncbi:B4GA1 glucuronyltransferase, partial [Rhagologus leucostigma]|nr:B4GA1 glucuronyltransferase [Rhagologus leucostigma]
WARVVFVLPAFEVRAARRLPGTKAELLRLWGAGDARPFYGTLCPRCQAPGSRGDPLTPPSPQACELHVAGFRFAVLDGAFVTHRGFKEPGGFHGAREAELGLNRRLFRAFRAELARRYPGSPRRC